MMNTCWLLFYRYHRVSAIKTGRGEIIVEKIGFESCQAIEVVFSPLPDIAICVMEPHGVRRVHVDRLWWEGGREGEREGGRGRREGEEGRKKEREGRRKRREGEGGKESKRGKERGRGGRERREGER